MKLLIKLTVFVLMISVTFGYTSFVEANADEEKIDIASDLVVKDMSYFVKTMTYEPRERINNISFYYEGQRLSSVKDYTISYENNELPGTAKITYTGAGRFTGTYEATFVIKKKSLADITTKASFNSKKVLEVSANNGSEVLVLNTDYTYSSSTDVNGNVTVTFEGIGPRYSGSAKVKIKAKDNPFPSAKSYLKDVDITKCKNIKGKKVSLKWKKIKKIAGYQIKYYKKGESSSAKTLTLDTNYKSFVLNKLKKNKTYYIKMRSYIAFNNKLYYGSWSKKNKVVINK